MTDPLDEYGPARYWIHPDKRPVRAWSEIYVPWENLSREQGQLKQTLQHAVGHLGMLSGTRCAWLSGLKGGKRESDPENLLLYNIGMWQNVSLNLPAVRFYWDDGKSRADERARMRKPPEECPLSEPAFHYRYWVENQDGPAFEPHVFKHAFFSETVALDRKTFTGDKDRYARRVWLSVSAALQEIGELQLPVHGGRFGLQVTISAGEEHARTRYPIKQVLDGVLCALHILPEGYKDCPPGCCNSRSTEIAARLQAEFKSVPFAGISTEREKLEALLFARKSKALGYHPFINRSLQFGPNDSLCEMGELRFRKHKEAGHLSATIQLFTEESEHLRSSAQLQ